MARRKVARQWEIVEGSRGGERYFRLDPVPGGFKRTRVDQLGNKPGERVLRAGRTTRAYVTGPRGGLKPIATTRRMRQEAEFLRSGGATERELAVVRPGSERQRRLLVRLERERGGPAEIPGLHGPGADAAGYRGGGAGWGAARDMATRLGLNPDAIRRNPQGFSEAVAAQLRLVARDSWKIGNVFDDAEERTLVGNKDGSGEGECEQSAWRLWEQLDLSPPPPAEPETGSEWLKPYVVTVKATATNAEGEDSSIVRSNWVWAKDFPGMLCAAIVGGFLTDYGWVTSKRSVPQGFDEESRAIVDLVVDVEVRA